LGIGTAATNGINLANEKYLRIEGTTDRQLALLKISIEAGILLCGNGFHAMMVARTRRS
jgi:hypothetical protein